MKGRWMYGLQTAASGPHRVRTLHKPLIKFALWRTSVRLYTSIAILF